MYKLAIMNHFKRIHEFLTAVNGVATMDMRSFAVEIKARNRYYQLQPQFFCSDENGSRYTTMFNKEVAGFIGWLPYFNKRWDIATGKIPFKEYALATGLPTPQMHDPSQLPLRNVVLKKSVSSFGNGLSGPYRELNSLEGISLGPGDYFESFIDGQIAKIWFWNDIPAALELRQMPRVTGDGLSSIDDLLAKISHAFYRNVNDRAIDQVLAFSGYTRTDVPAKDEEVLVDYVYMSPYVVPQWTPVNAFYDEKLPAICRDQLSNIGKVLNEAIPLEIRRNTVYTVDAILDQDNQFVLLEANCNPQLHLDVYPLMLKSLFLD